MSHVVYKQFDQLQFADVMVYNAIPPHPFWDKIDQVVDFTFVDKICEPLYSPLGQRPYAPSLKLKIHLVQRYYNISDREMEQKIIGDIYIKRFLGLPITHAKFDHSTIGLDRDRLGAEMFHVCHVYILAQALAQGLWGDEDDRWLVDSFHTNANVAAPSAHELIQQAAQQIIRHLKKRNPGRYVRLKQNMDVGSFFRRLEHDCEEKKRNVAFSKTVVQAYGLIAWLKRFETENTFHWESEEEQKASKKHCELLLRILRENVTEVGKNTPDPKDANNGGRTHTNEPVQSVESQAGSTQPHDTSEEPVKYLEMDKKQKPSDRIVSVYDPEVRCGYKTIKKSFIGDKVQVVESSKSHLILLAEPIAGNEADGQALVPLVNSVVNEFDVRPSETVADSAYGWGSNRELMHSNHIRLTAPLPKASHSASGLFQSSEFQYIPEEDVVICPAKQKSYRKTHITESQGTQYVFDKETCNTCPLKAQCTKSKSGRTVFISDYAELIKEGMEYNASEAGQEALKARYEIERTNNEMKRHHGLERPRTRGRSKFRISVKITSILINIKVMVKSLTKRPKPKLTGSVCP